jgi:hypothetical protein
MTWKEAIAITLQRNGEAMHYQAISDYILNEGLKQPSGATPAATVISVIVTEMKDNPNSLFIRIREGEYFLRDPEQQILPLPQAVNEPADEQLIERAGPIEEVESHLIKAYGMYWLRDRIIWKVHPKLLGYENPNAQRIDFSNQIGIYILHDQMGIVYIGQALKQTLGKRLYDHTIDRLRGRWDRFSWFGLHSPCSDGTLKENGPAIETNMKALLDAFEALLIEAVEPRQNRKSGNQTNENEYLQADDPEKSSAEKKRLLAELSSSL